MTIFYALLAAAGVAGGLLAGLLGIGGGIFFLLVLPDALHHLGVADADVAATVVANSLVGTLISALAAGVQHLRQHTPGRDDITWIGLPAAVTAYLTLRFVVHQPGFSELVFNRVVVVLLLALLARTLYGFLREKHLRPIKGRGIKVGAGAGIAEVSLPGHTDLLLKGDARPSGRLIITGTLAGLVSSLTGLGGGVFTVPVLREWLHYPIRRASFVSSGAIVLSSVAALLFSLSTHPTHPLPGTAGFIVPRVCFPIGAGVVLAAPLGVRLATRLSPRALTLLYMVFVAIVLVRRGWEAF